MLSDGHEDLDEANDTFRRVRVPALKMSHPWVRKRCGSYGLNSIKKFRTRAHKASLISVQVGVGQRCRALDVESPAILPTMSTRNVPAGR
eukprot:scaffold57308_cov59-Phaeocystis_antarctica.AAC.2